MQITEVQTPIPDYTITLTYEALPYVDYSSWVPRVRDAAGAVVWTGSPYNGYLTRYFAKRDAKRAIKRMIEQRTRTYNVTVEA